jgi:hypothetical protein
MPLFGLSDEQLFPALNGMFCPHATWRRLMRTLVISHQFSHLVAVMPAWLLLVVAPQHKITDKYIYRDIHANPIYSPN